MIVIWQGGFKLKDKWDNDQMNLIRGVCPSMTTCEGQQLD